ncbi:hypothetical protein V2J09_004045 [Rumex salicifolius]
MSQPPPSVMPPMGTLDPLGHIRRTAELSNFAHTNNRRWLLARDFNATMSTSERTYHSDSTLAASQDFAEWVDNTHLLDLGFSGPGATFNTYKASRLDGGLCFDSWLLRFPEAGIHHISVPHSDHLPLLLQPEHVPNSVDCNRPFRFQDAWMLHESFKAPCPRFGLRPTHSPKWNRTVFGNIFQRKRKLWAHLEAARSKLASSPSRRIFELERSFCKVLHEEQLLWFQKSRSNFLLEGDRNTRCYHLSTVVRQRSNKIISLQDENENWVSSLDELCQIVLQFFAKLYSEEPSLFTIPESPCYSVTFPPLDPEVISDVSKPFSDGEVWNSLKCMGPYKAPDPDGFPTVFYQQNWDLLHNDICSAVLNLVNNGDFRNNISNSLLVLLPKVDTPQSPAQLRPICLLNVIFKLSTKLLVNRLKPILFL